MCRTPAVTRPVRYGQVRGNGVCVESIGKIEKTKNKNFQNFSISRCWSACGTHFTLLKIFWKSYRCNHLFFATPCAFWTQWDAMGYLEVAHTVQKMSVKLTRKWPQPVHSHSRHTKIADFTACKNRSKVQLLQSAYFSISGVPMGSHRSIPLLKNEPQIQATIIATTLQNTSHPIKLRFVLLGRW